MNMFTSNCVADENTPFPVLLKLKYLHVLVVGGGVRGLEKLSALLSHCPEVEITLVGRVIDERITQLAAKYPSVVLRQKVFSPGDLFNKELAIIATNDAEEEARIRQYAKAMRVLVNVTDNPVLCDFFLV